MGVYKEFSQELFDKHNAVATEAVIRYLLDEGNYVLPNEDKYGPDLVLFEDLQPSCYIEVEHRNKWVTGPFPWALVNILERKTKYLGGDLPCEFWILSNDLKFCVIVVEHSIYEDMLVEVPNSQVANGEMMYRIPIEECTEMRI